ncbi:MAG: hypothetical protein DRH70_06515 [Candidatus Coatesbacteria bacterium]|nr:MAG: hypothetical protein DRH70_06515 [Candidatus Coatesbacteria bacterium]
MDQRRHAERTYHSVRVKTASGPRVILMFYEGGLKAAGLAKRKIIEGNIREAYKYRGKLLCVLSGLLSSLTVEAGHKEVNSFLFLYSYMSKLAREAQIDKQDHASFDEIMRILTELRSSWQRMLVDNGIV